MLELKNIKKTYRIGDIETKALDGISLAFRQKEFVAILGTSGSGKTTCLNIIGGLDRYDSGEMTIKGKKTSDFKEKDWDAYRNNSIGFVFQSYNLIMHLSIVANVEMGMTLSGVSAADKHKKALDVLEQVGLKEHLHKKPNQLSGGQMQRVAIARALANDPEILLCDEPTGALDTETSIQIMELIKKVAQDRLVIMVTHNPDLAKEYADRIIRFQDGKVISDSHPHQERPKESQFSLKKTSMSFFTALRLSFNNIRTKKGRTFLTSFASSIGIIGIAVILSLSTGFQTQIDEFQRNALAEFPITISRSAMEVNMETMETMHEEMKKQMLGTEEYADSQEVYLYDPSENQLIHENKLDEEYLKYLNAIDPSICRSIGYLRMVNMNLLRQGEDGYEAVAFTDPQSGNQGMASAMSGMNGAGLSSYPETLDAAEQPYLERNYDLLSGQYPQEATDLVLVVDTHNRVNIQSMKAMGFDTEGQETISFDEVIGTQFKLIANDDYYVKTDFGNYMPGTELEAMAASEDALTLQVVGVVRKKEDVNVSLLGSGIAYSDRLTDLIIDREKDSEIVTAQEDSDVNVMTLEALDEETKEQMVAYLGGSGIPSMIMLYPVSFEDKDQILEYLDAYNEGKASEDQIVYTDLASTMSTMTSGIMDGITIVLVAFAAISLVVSLIMICIITYTSVLERTKEIGILRALGARKKDITRVFDAETCLLGIFSGLLGVGISWLLTFPINSLLYRMTELEGVSHLQLSHALILVAVSTVLTILGGHVPARMASKKDAVEALRSE